MQEWISPAVAIIGSILGSYLGVRIALTRLEVQVTHLNGLVKEHDSTLDNLSSRLTTAESDLERMKADIGTHDTGLRGQTHLHATTINQHEVRLHQLERNPRGVT